MIRMSDVWDRSAAIVATERRRFAAVAVVTPFLPIAVQEMAQPVQSYHPMIVAAIGLVAALIVIFGYAAIQALAIAPERGTGGAWRVAAQRYPVLLGVAALLVAIFAVALSPAFAAIKYSAIDWQGMQGGGTIAPAAAGTIALAGLWTATVLIVALFVGARLALVYPIVLEERRGLGAIARSWRLTRTLTWKIIGVNLLFALVLGVALMATRFVGGTVFELLAGGDKPITVASVLTAVAFAAVETIGLVYIVAFFGRLYVAARDRHEARPATA